MLSSQLKILVQEQLLVPEETAFRPWRFVKVQASCDLLIASDPFS